jgi:hypothetical protein
MATTTGSDMIMASVFKEAKKAVRKDFKEELANLRAQLKLERKERNRLSVMEKDLENTQAKLKKEIARVDLVGSKIIREYDKILRLKRRSIGAMMTESGYINWNQLGRERAAVAALRKKAKSQQ